MHLCVNIEMQMSQDFGIVPQIKFDTSGEGNAKGVVCEGKKIVLYILFDQ